MKIRFLFPLFFCYFASATNFDYAKFNIIIDQFFSSMNERQSKYPIFTNLLDEKINNIKYLLNTPEEGLELSFLLPIGKKFEFLPNRQIIQQQKHILDQLMLDLNNSSCLCTTNEGNVRQLYKGFEDQYDYMDELQKLFQQIDEQFGQKLAQKLSSCHHKKNFLYFLSHYYELTLRQHITVQRYKARKNDEQKATNLIFELSEEFLSCVNAVQQNQLVLNQSKLNKKSQGQMMFLKTYTESTIGNQIKEEIIQRRFRIEEIQEVRNSTKIGKQRISNTMSQRQIFIMKYGLLAHQKNYQFLPGPYFMEKQYLKALFVDFQFTAKKINGYFQRIETWLEEIFQIKQENLRAMNLTQASNKSSSLLDQSSAQQSKSYFKDKDMMGPLILFMLRD